MKITAKHLEAIKLLAMGTSNTDTAKQLGVAPETVSKWKANFDFQAELNTTIKATQEATEACLRALNETAINTIAELLNSPETPPQERLKAAFKILELNNVKPSAIGSINPDILRKEKEHFELMESFKYG